MQVLNQEMHWVSNVAITCNIPSQSGGKSSCMVMVLKVCPTWNLSVFNFLLVCFTQDIFHKIYSDIFFMIHTFQ